MYTSQSRVEAFLKRDLTDEETLFIDETIAYVSSFIDSYTNRSWQPLYDEDDIEPIVETRVFDGNGRRELHIGDYSELVEIELLDSQGDVYQTIDLATDWVLTPANNSVYQDLHLRNYRFPIGTSNVRITAVFGSGPVPKGVVLIATAMVAKQLSKQAGSDGKFKSESIEGYSYTLKTDAEQDTDIRTMLTSLDMYKRILI